MAHEIPTTHDTIFELSSTGAGLLWGWHWLKAVCWQESRFDQYAVSHAGACGIAQFMPRTWHDVCDRMQCTRRSPFEPRYAIPAAAWYLNWLRDRWTWERPEEERRRLVLASWNAGLSNIRQAQRKSGNCLLWADIRVCLEAVTGPENAHETNTFVDKVERFAATLDPHQMEQEPEQ